MTKKERIKDIIIIVIWIIILYLMFLRIYTTPTLILDEEIQTNLIENGEKIWNSLDNLLYTWNDQNN